MQLQNVKKGSFARDQTLQTKWCSIMTTPYATLPYASSDFSPSDFFHLSKLKMS